MTYKKHYLSQIPHKPEVPVVILISTMIWFPPRPVKKGCTILDNWKMFTQEAKTWSVRHSKIGMGSLHVAYEIAVYKKEQA